MQQYIRYRSESSLDGIPHDILIFCLGCSSDDVEEVRDRCTTSEDESIEIIDEAESIEEWKVAGCHCRDERCHRGLIVRDSVKSACASVELKQNSN